MYFTKDAGAVTRAVRIRGLLGLFLFRFLGYVHRTPGPHVSLL